MPTGSIASDVAMAFFFVSTATANFATIGMIKRINEVVPETERESYFSRVSWRYRSKFKNFFPDDNLLQIHDISLGCMFFGFVAVCLTLL